MRKRVLSTLGSKEKIRLLALLFVLIAIIITGMIFAFAHSEQGDIKEGFLKSINYDPSKGLLSFSIPQTIPDEYKFYLHVSGRLFMGDKTNGMSFHAYDQESQNYTWESGKTYKYPLDSENLDFILLDFGLIDKKSNEFLYEYTIQISSDGTKNINKIK